MCLQAPPPDFLLYNFFSHTHTHTHLMFLFDLILHFEDHFLHASPFWVLPFPKLFHSSSILVQFPCLPGSISPHTCPCVYTPHFWMCFALCPLLSNQHGNVSMPVSSGCLFFSHFPPRSILHMAHESNISFLNRKRLCVFLSFFFFLYN